MFAIRRAAASGGMVPAPTPTFSYGGTSSNIMTYTITNYNPNLAYTVSKLSGTGNAPSLNTANGVITTTGVTGDVDLSVTSSSAKGGFTSTSTQPSRRVYTYYSYTCQVNIGPCSFHDNGGHFQYQNCHGPGTCHAKNSTPAGYTDSGSEWYRV
jgi:hypothetical protein